MVTHADSGTRCQHGHSGQRCVLCSCGFWFAPWRFARHLDDVAANERRAAKRRVRLTRDYYVYVLADPRDNAVFYVGKGTGRRVKDHAAFVRKHGACDWDEKERRIADIHRAGHKVDERIVAVFSADAFGNEAENCAMTMEAHLIAELSQPLLNIAGIVETAYADVVRTKPLPRDVPKDMIPRRRPRQDREIL